MSLEAVKEARQKIAEANGVLRATAKETVQHEIEQLFLADEDVQNIVWAQKSGEYNDEGMYPGVHGPILNSFDSEEGIEDLSEFIYPGPVYGMLYAYPPTALDPRAQRLSEALNAVGEEVLSDLFGEENVVIVERTGEGARITTEYAGV